eukprot:g56433.t1
MKICHGGCRWKEILFAVVGQIVTQRYLRRKQRTDTRCQSLAYPFVEHQLLQKLSALMASLTQSQTGKDVDETIARMMTTGQVEAVLLANKEGRPLRSVPGMDDEDVGEFTSGTAQVLRAVHKMLAKVDAEDETVLVRITTKKKELMIVPDKHYSMISRALPTATPRNNNNNNNNNSNNNSNRSNKARCWCILTRLQALVDFQQALVDFQKASFTAKHFVLSLKRGF